MTVEVTNLWEEIKVWVDFQENNPEKAIQNKLKVSNEKQKEEANFYVEWTEQMKVCVENNSKAMDMFCMDVKKWLFSAPSTIHLAEKNKKDS